LYPSLLAYGDTNIVPGINQGQVRTSVVNYRVFRDPGTVYTNPAYVYKDKVESMSANLNFTHQVLSNKYGNHEIKLGGNYDQYKVRHWEASAVGFCCA
jgi:hypothetical protein